MIMNALICTNPSRDADGAITERVYSFLVNHGVAVAKCGMSDIDTLSGDGYSLLIVLGGDGTILRSAPYAAKADALLLGINIGSVGYLSAFGRNELEQGLARVIGGEYKIEARMMLDVMGKLAINEAVIYRGLNPRPIHLKADVVTGAERLSRNIKGDGLIIASPTGSTAYSLYAGGKSAEPTSEQLLFTPVCADTSAEVILVNAEITVTLEGEVTAALSIDGCEPQLLNIGDSVIVKKARHSLKLIKLM
jgi:NAD+ kinase